MRPTIRLEEWHFNGDRLFGRLEDGSQYASTFVEVIPGNAREGDVAVTHDACYILGKPMMEVNPRASGRRSWLGAWIWIGGTAVAVFTALLIIWSRS